DEFLLGDAVLVAPVLDRGARSRRVYLPAGRWYAWNTLRAHDGPAWIDVDAGLDEVPVFQRAGTVVPMLPTPAQRLGGPRWEAGAAARDAERRGRPSHEYALSPEPVRPGMSPRVDVSAPAELGGRRFTVRASWGDGAAEVPMTAAPSADGVVAWSASLPPADE